ncbi:MAG: glutamine synthetase [Acidimicrobiia bacterium]|nr:glutamine synthetase [Acidimicrobiia bacterium]
MADLDAARVPAWLDEHDIRWVKTESSSLDGLVVGKHIGRAKFAKTLPLGNAITELVLGYDLGGTPYLAWWDDWRADALGDIHQRPDLTTLVVAPDRPRTANVICDFVTANDEPLPSCSRGVLRTVLEQLAARGFAAKAAFEIEAMLFTDSLATARRRHFRGLTPMSTDVAIGYLHHNSRQQLAYIDDVLLRLEALGIPVEGWHDEAAPAQFEINVDPADPLTACDHVVRAKQVMREVAMEQGHVVTFMAKPSAEYGNGLHVHHSLTRDGEPVFYAPDGRMSETTSHWIGGLMAHAAAATSFLCPMINSYRRMVGFAAVPTVASWGEDNKSAALRVLSIEPKAARVENRVAGGDANPYLVLAATLASGIAGLDAEAPLPAPLAVSGWGLPPQGYPHLPNSITRAADTLEADTGLAAVLGADFVRYWINTRRWEWLMFHTTGGDPTAETVTEWELDRYFELT